MPVPENVEMVEVESSNIKKIGYDAPESTMYVMFKHGGIYQLEPITETSHSEFMDAPSKGKYYAANFRGNKDIRITKVGA